MTTQTTRITPEKSAIVLANDLQSGRTVYLTVEGQWHESLACARVVHSEGDAERAMDEAKASEKANGVVGAYLVSTNQSGIPEHIRETIRTTGPSVTYGVWNVAQADTPEQRSAGHAGY